MSLKPSFDPQEGHFSERTAVHVYHAEIVLEKKGSDHKKVTVESIKHEEINLPPYKEIKSTTLTVMNVKDIHSAADSPRVFDSQVQTVVQLPSQKTAEDPTIIEQQDYMKHSKTVSTNPDNSFVSHANISRSLNSQNDTEKSKQCNKEHNSEYRKANIEQEILEPTSDVTAQLPQKKQTYTGMVYKVNKKIEKRSLRSRNDRNIGETKYTDRSIRVSHKLNSCEGKCDQTQNFPCSCNYRCVIYENCCEDITTTCPNVKEEGRNRFSKQIMSQASCINNYFTVTSCPNTTIEISNNTPKNPKQFLKSLINVPIVDISTGVLYMNREIFECFATNESKPIAFNIELTIPSHLSPSTTENFLGSLLSSSRPRYLVPHVASDTLSSCFSQQSFDHVDTCHLQSEFEDFSTELTQMKEWSKKCTAFFSYVEINSIKFKNKYCAFCKYGYFVDFSNMITRPIPDSDKNHVTLSVTFQVIGDDLSVKMASKNRRVYPWTLMECDAPESQEMGLLCKMKTCSIGYTKTPRGTCAFLQEAILIFPQDEFPLFEHQFRHMKVLFECKLKSILEISNSHPFEIYTYLYKKTNELSYCIKFFFFESTLVLDAVQDEYQNAIKQKDRIYQIFADLIQLTKAFKYYRMKSAHLYRSSLKTVKPQTTRGSTTLNVADHFSLNYLGPQFQARVQPFTVTHTENLGQPNNLTESGSKLMFDKTNETSDPTAVMWNMSMCLSTSLKEIIYHHFFCLDVVVFEHERVQLNELTSDRCFDAFQRAVDSGGRKISCSLVSVVLLLLYGLM